MISVILAGGYAKRLWPLTEEIAKPLLPIGNKRIIDYIMEKLMNLNRIRKIIVSTNLRFKEDFENWAKNYPDTNLELIYDRSYREEEKPGAIKALSDIASGLHDDCLVIAGDNLFTDSLEKMIEEYDRRGTVLIGLYNVSVLELAKSYGVVQVDHDLRILSIEEKPGNPKTTLVSTGIYILPERILPKLTEYIVGGYNPDELGRFLEWLLKLEPIYGYILSGEWYDIGTWKTYKSALERFQAGEKDKNFSAPRV